MTLSTVAQSSSPPTRRPKPVRANTPGSFAHDTMTRRLREEILGRIFKENDFRDRPEMLSAFQSLDTEMKQASTSALRKIRPSEGDDQETDLDVWDSLLKSAIENGETWTTAPWLLSEFYFYRRISEAVAYHRTKFDPFEAQKIAGISGSHRMGELLISQTRESILSCQIFDASAMEGAKEALRLAILRSLWGNQADLSLWPSETESPAAINGSPASAAPIRTPPKPSHVIEHAQTNNQALEKFLLANQFDDLWGSLVKAHSNRSTLTREVGIVTDNVGPEFLADLCLITTLLELRLAEKVTLWVKARPVYVSDVMKKDVSMHVDEMEKIGGVCADMAKQWRSYSLNDQLAVEDHEFFCQPVPFWDAPADLLGHFKATDLMIIKGDANYRRLVEDLSWDMEDPFSEAVGRFPTRVLALRTLKAEVGLGMDPAQIEKARQSSPDWMVGGQWGVLQFAEAAASTRMAAV